ncbi:MAG: mRNA splicing protein [Phylliscum demangeonii]|nr:MAG: mRNA splicing protein [Phylliscum demangeonii]
MASLTTSLARALPKPKFAGEHEAIPVHAEVRGPRIIGAESVSETQMIVKRAGPPPYRQRAGWRPRAPEDYGDGGAFPEIPVAQYPLDMGRKTSSSSNALALQVDAEGKVKYDAIARQGHNDKRIVHASFKDLIPLRQRADVGDISLERPSEDEVAAQTEKTKQALAKLVAGAVAAQKPKNVNGVSKREATYVRYTPANQMGDTTQKSDRIMKIVERQQDPMEPPKFKHKKIPRGPPSPPAPVMHSPPRKLTAEDQEAWRIPPPVSNWKNPKGYTVPLDKRLAADGRGLQDVTINDKFAQFAEALFTADRHAREEVKQRAQMQQKLAEKEKAQKEEHLRMLAQRARDERSAAIHKDRRRSPASRSPSEERSRSRNKSSHGQRARSRSRRRGSSAASSSSRRSRKHSSDDDATRDRLEMRRERRREAERQLRQSRMGAERRMQVLAREQNRDISEKIALGLAKPTQSSETMWDSRLFNQTSGFDTGFNEDQPYDKPLFAAQDAISSIYRPRAGGEDEELGEEEKGNELERIKRAGRFDVLGRAKEGFKGAADVGERDGPVQFEKDTTAAATAPAPAPAATADPFKEVDDFLSKFDRAPAPDGERVSKRHGVPQPQSQSQQRRNGAHHDDFDDDDNNNNNPEVRSRAKKRARVEEDHDGHGRARRR